MDDKILSLHLITILLSVKPMTKIAIHCHYVTNGWEYSFKKKGKKRERDPRPHFENHCCSLIQL